MLDRFRRTRAYSCTICANLLPEDMGLQAVEETSPLKWHLAHTSWFFETFILKQYQPDFKPFDPAFEYLFNSYYNAVGEQFPRGKRFLLSRPSVEQIYTYRAHVDTCITDLLQNVPAWVDMAGVLSLLELGINHEQQHQELMFTDLKYNWFQNPLFPVYKVRPDQECAQQAAQQPLSPPEFLPVAEGVYSVGVRDAAAFHFDNEGPRHKTYLHAYSMANRLVSNGEYLAFIKDGGYKTPALWLSEGWSYLQQNPECAKPLYWQEIDGVWHEFTLHGLEPLDLNRPVCHVNAYEADAYARWAGARLPTEFEWEVFADKYAVQTEASPGYFHHEQRVHPDCGIPVASSLLGQVWQWTSSDYKPYPGYQTAAGAVGEYNGKFMISQLVLRGGSCVTAYDHFRTSYRNFFYARDQWQFTGIVLAKDGQ